VQLTGGHIETAVDVLFCLGLYYGLRWWQVVPRRGLLLVLPALAVALGAALAAAQLLPFLEWLPLSAEYARRPPAAVTLFDPRCWRELLALPLALFPNLYGNPTWPGPYRSYLPWGNYSENVLYVGTVPPAAGSSASRRRSWRRACSSRRRATSSCRSSCRASRRGGGTWWKPGTRPCPRRPIRSTTSTRSSTRSWPACRGPSASATSPCTRPPWSRSAAGSRREAPRAGRFSSCWRRRSWSASGAGTRLRCRCATSTRRRRPCRASPATERSTA